MNERERFIQTLTFGHPDKVPLSPGEPRESTLVAWRAQGLPAGVHWRDHLHAILGLPAPPARPRVDLGVSFIMHPTFEEKVLAHRDGHFVVQDWMGAITEISDAYDYSYIRVAKDFVTRHWHSFPVRSRADWEGEMRWRYDPNDPARFPEDFEARCRALRDRDTVLRVSFPGPFWQLREWLGFENLCLLLVDDPEFALEMIGFWEAFVSQVLAPILERVAPDYVQINEDMAYKLHSMISPAMARRFLLPTWQRWGEAINGAGCPVYSMDSDGYAAELLPLWMEAGFNCCFPTEVAAGNDIVAYRRRYGRQMAFIGGVDKRALAAGGRTMREEVLRVVPPLLEEGGFIPGCDHGVPPDISWPNFVAYTRLLAQLLGWM